jgi:hypothetical protein
MTSGCPSSSQPTPIPISNSTNHSTNIPAIVGGVVGALFVVAVAMTLTLIYVFCYKCPTKSGGGGGPGLWVYSS